MKVVKMIMVTMIVACVGNAFSQELIPNSKPKSQFDVNYTTSQQEASFDGGLEAMVSYISTKIVMPEKKEGRVANALVRVVIDAEGNVSEVEVMTSINQEVVKALVDVIKGMPKWTPAKVNGEAVLSEQIISYEIKY